MSKTFKSFKIVLLQKKSIGNDLYEQVFYSLDLIEKDYFGLQFTDAFNICHWLDPTKSIKKQIKSKFLTSYMLIFIQNYIRISNYT